MPFPSLLSPYPILPPAQLQHCACLRAAPALTAPTGSLAFLGQRAWACLANVQLPFWSGCRGEDPQGRSDASLSRLLCEIYMHAMFTY